MRSSVYGRGMVGVRANMTPLIDVVFLLMIFFMLVAQLQRVEKLELDLPEIASELGLEASGDGVVVINVSPEGSVGSGGVYRVGSRWFGGPGRGLDELEATLRAYRERVVEAGGGGAARVQVRADRGERYGRVEPLLGVLSRAGLGRVELIVRGGGG